MPAELTPPAGIRLADRKPPSIADQVRAAMSTALTPAVCTANVLIVDDELVVLHVMTSMLEKLGHAAWRALNARQAFELLARPVAFDLAVIDLVLPGISGIDLAKRIHQRCPRLPLIAMSGVFTPESGHVARAFGTAGIVGFIAKPIQPPELREAVKTALAAAG